MRPPGLRPPQVLLFDLGRVLVDFDFGRALEAWAPHSALSAEALRLAFRHDEAYERHERGELTAAQYFAHLAATLQLDASPARIEQGWNAIFLGEIVRTRRMVEQLRGRLPCHVFSNTNATHLAACRARFPALFGAVDGIFTSHELGLRKPDRAAFERVCALIGCPPAAVLFFDDLAENVAGARSAGLQAVQVHSPDDVAAALRVHGHALADEAGTPEAASAVLRVTGDGTGGTLAA
ncbi:MAG: HAD family phosphatase [Ideonella sp.]|nr:HAD family phosphatase [Ideonella sp.]